MQNKIKQLIEEAEQFSANKIDQIEEFRIKYLSKKGVVSTLFEEFRTIPNNEKKEVGQLLNQLKITLQN